MMELEKAIEDIKIRYPDRFDNLPEEEWEKGLSLLAKEIGRQMSRVSPNSEWYGELRKEREKVEEIMFLLRKEEKQKSGLSALGSTIISADMEQPDEEVEQANEEIKQVVARYKEAYGNKAVKEMKECYKILGKHALNKNLTAMIALGDLAQLDKQDDGRYYYLYAWEDISGKRDGESCYKLGLQYGAESEEFYTYLKEARKLGYLPATHLLASTYAKSADAEQWELSYKLWKEYFITKNTVNPEVDEDRAAIYYYYKMCEQLGKNIIAEKKFWESKNIEVSWESLLQTEGSYTKETEELYVALMNRENRMLEVVDTYLKRKKLEDIQALTRIFFHSYFEKDLQNQQALDRVLAKMRDSIEEAKDIRVELYGWYADRHLKGEFCEQDDKKAFILYDKAIHLCMSDIHAYRDICKHFREQRDNLVKDKTDNQKIIFYNRVMEEGYIDVSLDIGMLYEKKRDYLQAISFYSMCANKAKKKENRAEANSKKQMLERKIDKQQVDRLECEKEYQICMGKELAYKVQSFQKLMELAEKGNNYAALCAAKVSENMDEFLKAKTSVIPENRRILHWYLQAAKGDEIEAMERLVQVYENGELGQACNHEKALEWRMAKGE